jgi:3-oxoacyl-[acyl-carrier protein] reductase
MGLLSGKIALVSGSSRGIGNFIARAFLARDAIVYVTGREQKHLDSAVADLRSVHPDAVRSYCGDLTQTETIRDLMDLIRAQEGHLDITVANIGSGKSKTGWNIDDPDWQACIEKNFFSSVRLARESLRLMVPARRGSIIFISSIAGCEVINAPAPYAAAKAALLSYMKYTSRMVGGDGIRLNAISPGNVLFEGGTWSRKIAETPDEVQKYVGENVPLRRFATPEEIGLLASYLASDDAAFVTGSNFIIDGGQTRAV